MLVDPTDCPRPAPGGDPGPTQRIVIATHYWHPHRGGVETVAESQATALAARGWSVEVFTSRLSRDPHASIRSGVTVWRYRCINVLERFGIPVPLVSPLMAVRMYRAAASRDAVLLAHGHVYISSLFAAVIARLLKRPLILMQHSPRVFDHGLRSKIADLADATIGRYVIGRADIVLAVSDHTRRYVQELAHRPDVRVIRSGVDARRFSVVRHGRHEDSTFVCVTVRRLVRRNGLDILVAAWIDAGLDEDCRLIIVGEGPEHKRLKGMTRGQPRIELAGALSDEATGRLLSVADVFVFPSRAGEGFGLAAAEALACGLPVLASDVGGIGEVVQNGVTGLLVEPGNVRQLARALSALRHDVALRERLAAAAVLRADEFAWGTAVAALEAELQACCDQTRARGTTTGHRKEGAH